MDRIPSHCWAQPLAQDWTEVCRLPDPEVYCSAPSLVRLPSGRLLCSFALLTRLNRLPGNPDQELRTRFWASGDGGATWRRRGRARVGDGLLFVHRGRLYLLCNGRGRRDILLAASGDEGETWSDPVVLFKGRYWNTFTPHAVRGDTLYWCFGAANEAGNFNRAGSRIAAVAGDLAAADLMDPSAWRISPPLTYPGTPPGLSLGLAGQVDAAVQYPGATGAPTFRDQAPDMGDHWLEPNVVLVDGRVRVYVRLRVDGQATPHLCAICDVDDRDGELDLRFTQFHPFPGNVYFHVIRDEPGGYYWTPVNLPTRAQDVEWGRAMAERGLAGGAGNERRFLMLMYSLDALNWFPAGCIARFPSPGQGLQYNAALIDGDDLLVSSRTAERARNQHDNDRITIHRVRDFRSLALDLHPGPA